MNYKMLKCTFIGVFFTIHTFAQNAKQVLPTKEQVTWADAEIGVIIHFDMNAFAPQTYHYGDKKTLPPLSVFHPSDLNTDQWIEAAKSAGAKYAVLVVKHGTGFSLWHTKAHNYNVSNTPWGKGEGDVLANFIQSCKKYNVKPGIYYSVNSNTLYGINDKIKIDPQVRQTYNKMAIQQLKELWGGRYGKFFEIWFDGGIMPSSEGGFSDTIADLVKKYQSQAILFQGLSTSSKNIIRWAGNEDGVAHYPTWSKADSTTSSSGLAEIKNPEGNPDGKMWCPAESDFPSRKNSSWEGGWFWHANRDEDVPDADELVKKYYTTVGRNTNMLIGMGIDTSGRFPEKETEMFKAFGDEIKQRFANCLGKTNGNKEVLTLSIGNKSVSCNQVVLMENITEGEHVREYILEAWINNKWEKINTGTSIGHKHIEVFSPVVTDKLRLTINKSDGRPHIKMFAAYNY